MTRVLPIAVVGVAISAWAIATDVVAPHHANSGDVPLYEDVARRIAGGEMPYRDFSFEYPPVAAGLFTVARLAPLSYGTAFSVLMLVALCATALGVLAAARALGMGPLRQGIAAGIVTLTPLLLGDFVATRFDLAVAALVAWSVYGAVSSRWWLAWGLLAAAIALKLAPIVLVPLFVLWHRRRMGGRSAFGALAAAAALVAVTFLPFLASSPGGVWGMFSYHLDRPLQIESQGSAALLGLHALADIRLQVATTFGSQNLSGSGPDAIATLSSALVVLGVAAVYATVAKRLQAAELRGGAQLFVAGAAATLAVTIALGKVLSPQFIVWLLPATLLVAGRFGRLAVVATVAVMLATQMYTPGSYPALVTLQTRPIVLLVIRDFLLVALVALAWPRHASVADVSRRAATNSD